MILVLPDLEILQDQNLLKNLSLKTEEEKVPNIQDPTQDLKRNRSRKIPEVLIPMMILNQNLKEELISRTKVRAMRKNLSENLKEVEKFDTRDKYERGSLKYGRRPSNGEEERG
jgi:23S rRNA pseudouridine2605 synthase